MKEINRLKKRNTSRISKNKSYYLLLVSGIIFIIQNLLFFERTINLSIWFFLIIFFSSIMSCFISLRNFLKEFHKLEFYIKFVKCFFVNSMLFLSFGLFFFGFINQKVSAKSELEIFECKISGIHQNTSKSSNRIYFEFKESKSGLPIPSSPEVYYLIKNKEEINKYYLQLNCRKGLFGTYVIENYCIVKEIIDSSVETRL